MYIDHVTYFNRTTTVTNLTRAYNTIRIPCPETRLFRVPFKWYKQIYKPIKIVINSFKFKAFKDKSLILTDIEIIYLNNILNIILIFIKATIKLQAKNYPTIYYIILEVYRIYTRLENFKTNFKISFNSFKIIYIKF